MKTFWILPLLAVSLAGADISGIWSGTIEVPDMGSGTTVRTPVRAQFEQKQNEVSGKIGRREDDDQVKIRNGKVEGKKIFFVVSSEQTDGDMKFDLTLDGEHIQGEMKGAVDSGPIVGKVSLIREKAPADR